MDYKNDYNFNTGLNQLLSDELSHIRHHLTSHAITRSVVNTMDEEFAGHLLHQSSLWGNHELLQDLLSGEQIQYLNATDSKGRTALQAAVCCDSESCTRILLTHGADPNIGQVNDPQNNTIGKNPLHIAAENGNLNIIKLLIAHKVDVLAKDGNGFTAMDIAEQSGHTLVMELLKEAVDNLERVRHELYESLCNACAKGNVIEARDILNKCGSDAEFIVNYTPNGCNTLLFKACQDGHKYIVELLISKGSDGRIHPVTKYSPLYIASYLGRKDIVEILLHHFPNLVNVSTVEKWLPIHGSAINNHLNIIDLLLNFDYPKAILQTFHDKNRQYEYYMPFDINAQDVTGQTVLYVAALVGNQRLIDFLLSFKVSAIKVEKHNNSNNETKCELISDKNNFNYNKDLKDNNHSNNCDSSNSSPTLRSAQRPSKRVSAIQKIIDKLSPTSGENTIYIHTSDDLNSTLKTTSISPVLLDIYCDDKSETALHACVRKRHYSIASVLLSNGSNPNLVIHLNSCDDKSQTEEQLTSTALKEAVVNRDASMVDLLIRYGARDEDCMALKVASNNGDNHLMSKLLSLKSHPDPEYKINKKALQFNTGSGGLGFVGNVTFSSMFPTTSVMINWHSLVGLTQVRKQWLIDASVAHNIKLKLNIQNQVTAITAITRLDLSNNGLKRVPFCVFRMPSLIVMNLSQNNLETLPETDSDLMSPIESTKSGISRMRKSKSYSSALTSNNSSNQTNVWSLPSLQELYLQDNCLECIPKCVFELQSLQLIDLSNNKLHSLPFAFWTAPKLREINLSLNLLRDLPVRSNTSSLHLSPLHQNTNPLKLKPKKIDSLVESLTISENDIELNESDSEDKEFENLVQKDVNRVNLWSKSVEVMAGSAHNTDEDADSRQYCKLVSLNLSHNGFQRIPPSLSCLAINLTRLNMSYNCLKSLDFVKSYPLNIKHIDLSHNQISEWFKVDFDDMSYNSDIMTCYCDPNQSSSSSPKSSTVSLKNLKSNSCCNHKQHNRLDNLRTLILADNKLPQIVISCEEKDTNCDEFEKLDENNHLIKGQRYSKLIFANLSMLDVSNNSISEISPNVSDLSNLSVLNLSANKDICYLPPEMGLLNKLWNLSTRGCNLNEPLKTMIESKKYKTMDVIGYLKSILENAKPYARMKLMIVGVQGIGKTSLLELLRQEGTGSFKRKPPEHWGKRMGNKSLNMKTPKGVTLSTVGVDVCDWTYEKRVRGQSSFGAVSFRTWDFGGQKEYYATHQYFLSKRSLYLVVWKIIDGERGVDGIFQWLVNIQARAPNSPVIIVGTHYDLVREYFPPFYAEELQQNIRQRFMNVVDADKCGLPRVIDSIEISIKTKHNIKLLCNLIYDTVFELRCPGSKERLLEQKVPATYLALEDVVSYLAVERKMEGKDPVLRSEQYKTAVIGEMMNRYGMTFRDMSELHSATIFLHENGVLLHYEDSTLKDLYFLDPQWLCDMLAHVVTIREINPYARSGLMKIDDLRQLFKLSQCAPTDAQTYLINLLNKFEVAVTWDSRTLLIPSLLHGEEDLRSGLPGCDVRIPLRSRGWALNKSYQTKDVLFANSLKILFKTESLFEAPKSPPIISLDEIQISVPEGLTSLSKPRTQCSVTVMSRPMKSIHRLLLMTYFPSGFWSRLMARILGDDSIIEIIRSYFKMPANAQSDPILLSLFNTKAEWLCWRTGLALKHFHTYLIRVKEVFPHLPLNPYDYYNMKFLAQMEGQWKDIQINKSSLLEIYLPNHCLFVETINSEGITKSYALEPNQELVSKLLVIVVEHMDTLLEDWYPTLGTRFVHTSEGKFLVTRFVPCTSCLLSQITSNSYSSTTASNSASNQLKSPEDIEWQMIDAFGGDAINRNIGSSDSRDSGMGCESRDSSRFSSVEGVIQKPSPQSCDRMSGEESVVYSFLVEECILAVYEQKAVVCPLHSQLSMVTIAPDTVFQDLGDHYLINAEKLRYGKLLGRGAFGFVFRAGIKESPNNVLEVAMKMLQPVDPGYGARKSDTVAFKAAHNKWERDPIQYACKAYCTARQELNILLNLKHSNIVPLVGLCTKPLSIILQLAPMGSLDHIIKNYRRSGVQFDVWVLQKVILQISKALEYLHRQHIIYRDLKSENVLVWEMPLPFEHFHPSDGPKVTIKLADYGISRPSLPTGTKGFGGTEGFMAPEIMRYNGEEEYTEKVDCFSFAMFLYELLTLHLPFENQECVKEHILEGGRPSLTQRDLLYPSYLIDLMTLCWAQQPKDRPSISQIVSIISAPEFTHLLDVICLNENYAVLSANGFNTSDQSLRLMLSRIGKQTDLITSNGFCWTEYQSFTSLSNITVMSICLVDEHQIWFGDSKACIHVYSVQSFQQISSIELELEDNTPTAIRCMCYVSAISQVAISSSSGRLWMCSTTDHTLKEIGNNGIPFLCVVNVDLNSAPNRDSSDCELWCGQSEGNIAIITLSQSLIKCQHIVSHYDDDSESRIPISERFDVYQITALYPYVWTHLYPGCIVWQWDVEKRSILTRLDCSKLAPCSESLMSISIEEHLSPGSCQVTALTVLEERSELYVGTTWGCLIIVEANTMRPITVFRPYEEEVKAIITFKPLNSKKLKSVSNESLEETICDKPMIATIGKGYRSLMSRFLHLDKNRTITQRGLHSILWSTTDWNIN